jgi:hypothetical protein
LEKANRQGDVFQCLKCEHRGHADQIAANNLKSRYFDREITLYTPKETVKEILLKRYNARLEHRNASSSDEKIRTVTVPGQTLERDASACNQVVTSIKEQNCDRQINKIGCDKVMA